MKERHLLQTNKIKYKNFIYTKMNGTSVLVMELFLNDKFYDKYEIINASTKNLLIDFITNELSYEEFKNLQFEFDNKKISYWRGFLNKKDSDFDKLIFMSMNNSYSESKEEFENFNIRYIPFTYEDKKSLSLMILLGSTVWKEILIADNLVDLEDFLNNEISSIKKSKRSTKLNITDKEKINA